MACRGVHFALDAEAVDLLLSQATDEARLDYLQETIEESYFRQSPEWVAETDKAWDAIHRTLTDGTLSFGSNTYPLSHAILGGQRLYSGEDYVMTLKTPAEVSDVADALSSITPDAFRQRYFAIDAATYQGVLDDEDFEYTWNWFTPLQEFFRRAAGASRFVLFSVDQ